MHAAEVPKTIAMIGSDFTSELAVVTIKANESFKNISSLLMDLDYNPNLELKDVTFEKSFSNSECNFKTDSPGRVRLHMQKPDGINVPSTLATLRFVVPKGIAKSSHVVHCNSLIAKNKEDSLVTIGCDDATIDIDQQKQELKHINSEEKLEVS